MHSGLTYLGKHSYIDLGVTMSNSREISIPNKKKVKQSIPFSNVVYDYSEIFGSQVYEERTLKYTFNIAGRPVRTKDDMNWLKTTVVNWIMKGGSKQPLYDDFFRNYYFLAEVEGGVSFIENWQYGFLEVVFTAYPFMIAMQPEGHDIWDDFNFIFDVTQDVTFTIPAYTGDYKALSVGSSATIAAWASATLEGAPGNLVDDVGITRTILSVEVINETLSKRAYVLDGFTNPVLEQDILQANKQYVDIMLINNGTPSVTPKLKLTRADGSSLGPKISIENLDTNKVYNILGNNPINHLFQLTSGENRLRLYGHWGSEHTIEFVYHKELI